jgi:hypothetical protein
MELSLVHRHYETFDLDGAVTRLIAQPRGIFLPTEAS